MPATMRDAGTTAICVSGNRLVAAGLSGAEQVIGVPVSAMAQKQPVTPTGSASRAARGAIVGPAPAQSRAAGRGHTTPCGASPACAR